MSIVNLTRGRVVRNTPAAEGFVVAAEADGATAATSGSKKSITDALTAVASYVPTEIIAAYTLALGVAVTDKAVLDEQGHPVSAHLAMNWFVLFAALTPLFVWLVFAVRSSEAKAPFGSPRLWPWWEAISAVIAFTTWSAALPKSAFAQWDWYDPGVAAVCLVIVSGLLPLVGAVVNRQKAIRSS